MGAHGADVVEMVGRRLGQLVVVTRAGQDNQGAATWFVRCDCGATKVVTGKNLRKGNTVSCGCHRRAISARRITAMAEATRTHGQSQPFTPEYRAWAAMKSRCLNPNTRTYANYGGRGITVCDRWRDSFESFFADMGRKPTPQHTIDRIDNDGNYEPSNCRWATKKEQAINRRPRTRGYKRQAR